MNLDDYKESDIDPLKGRKELEFCCANNHSVTVYTSDPYYPDWVECPHCGELMGSDSDE